MLFPNLSRQFLRYVAVKARSHYSMLTTVKVKSEVTHRPFKVSVEGNIGSGKTTFLNYFEQFPSIQTYDEPLDKWRNVEGHNLLGLLYDDIMKWNATFQSYVQLTRTQIQSSTPKEGVKVQIFERSIQNNRHCFLENSYKLGFVLPPQYAVLCKWYEWIEDNVDIALDLIVYLRTDPQVVYERVLSRNRKEEKSINVKYLESLHEAHEKWLGDPDLSIPVLVIDANVAKEDLMKCYKNTFLTLSKMTETIGISNIENERN